jgi:hypothetical protein
MLPDMDYEALNARVEAKLAQRKKLTRNMMFGVSILMFVIFALMGWLIAGGVMDMDSVNSSFEDAATTGLFLVTMGGFMAIIMNFIGIAIDTEAGGKQMRSQIMMEELGTNLQDLARGKAKRGQGDADHASSRLGDESSDYVELSDDGELVPLDERLDEESPARPQSPNG